MDSIVVVGFYFYCKMFGFQVKTYKPVKKIHHDAKTRGWDIIHRTSPLRAKYDAPEHVKGTT